MKYIFISCLLVLSLGSRAQNVIPDSGKIIPSIADYIPFIDSFLYFENKEVLQQYLEVKTASKQPLESIHLWDDQQANLVAFRCLIADCHGSCSPDAFWDENREFYTLRATSFYGGCRAGGKSKIIWMLIPKPVSQAQLRFQHVWLN